MKAVILAGGFGTRMTEETGVRPKPMVEVGERPLLWHIMKIYGSHGITDFVVCLGYRGYVIKEYFANYFLHASDVRIDLADDRMTVLNNAAEPWSVTLVDTGSRSMTGGRMRRVREHIGDETFCCTYGDGVSDVDIRALIAFHEEHGRKATLTAVQPPGRFGALSLHRDEYAISSFSEKPDGDGAWINGGFFVLEPSVLDYIPSDDTVFEQQPLRQLAADGELCAFKHRGYWQSMDTLRDKMVLEEEWSSPSPPWKVWQD